jgi:hypothetical protein
MHDYIAPEGKEAALQAAFLPDFCPYMKFHNSAPGGRVKSAFTGSFLKLDKRYLYSFHFSAFLETSEAVPKLQLLEQFPLSMSHSQN